MGALRNCTLMKAGCSVRSSRGLDGETAALEQGPKRPFDSHNCPFALDSKCQQAPVVSLPSSFDKGRTTIAVDALLTCELHKAIEF
jgi:hypothetical protein